MLNSINHAAKPVSFKAFTVMTSSTVDKNELKTIRDMNDIKEKEVQKNKKKYTFISEMNSVTDEPGQFSYIIGIQGNNEYEILKKEAFLAEQYRTQFGVKTKLDVYNLRNKPSSPRNVAKILEQIYKDAENT